MKHEWNVTVWQGIEPYLHNILNEVLHGMHVDLFQQLGATRAELNELLEKIDRIASEDLLTRDEARLLGRVAHLCDVELGMKEFHTRTGYTLGESQAIQERLVHIASSPVHAAAS